MLLDDLQTMLRGLSQRSTEANTAEMAASLNALIPRTQLTTHSDLTIQSQAFGGNLTNWQRQSQGRVGDNAEEGLMQPLASQPEVQQIPGTRPMQLSPWASAAWAILAVHFEELRTRNAGALWTEIWSTGGPYFTLAVAPVNLQHIKGLYDRGGVDWAPALLAFEERLAEVQHRDALAVTGVTLGPDPREAFFTSAWCQYVSVMPLAFTIRGFVRWLWTQRELTETALIYSWDENWGTAIPLSSSASTTEELATLRRDQVRHFAHWFNEADLALRDRAKTTCRKCCGRCHCSSINSREARTAKACSSMGLLTLKQYHRAGLLGAFREVRPTSAAALSKLAREQGDCPGGVEVRLHQWRRSKEHKTWSKRVRDLAQERMGQLSWLPQGRQELGAARWSPVQLLPQHRRARNPYVEALAEWSGWINGANPPQHVWVIWDDVHGLFTDWMSEATRCPLCVGYSHGHAHCPLVAYLKSRLIGDRGTLLWRTWWNAVTSVAHALLYPTAVGLRAGGGQGAPSS